MMINKIKRPDEPPGEIPPPPPNPIQVKVEAIRAKTMACVHCNADGWVYERWDECQTDPKTKGTSAVQFILTSSIVLHCLDLLGKVFINIFSCKEFDALAAEHFCEEFFRAESVVNRGVIERD